MAKTEERASQVAKKSRAYTRACAALGMRVRSMRQEQLLTLEAAAERMSMDLKHLQKIEAGQVNATMVTLVRIATGLGVGIVDLFVNEPPLPPPKRAASKAKSRAT